VAREKEHRGQNKGLNTGVRSQINWRKKRTQAGPGERRPKKAWPRKNFNFEFFDCRAVCDLGQVGGRRCVFVFIRYYLRSRIRLASMRISKDCASSNG
jgi:hypothetical protein